MALNNVPLAGQSLNVTRDPIRNNFQSINDGFAIDHQQLVVPQSGDAGKHNKVSFIQQSNLAVNEPVPSSGGFVMYNAIPSIAADPKFPVTLATPEINILLQGATKIIPMTASLKNPNGWTYLPSGILMKWGTATVTRNTLNTVTFPVGASIPVFSAVYFVHSPQTFAAAPSTGDLNVAVSAGNITTTAFQAFPRAIGLPSGGTVSILYIALGVGPV